MVARDVQEYLCVRTLKFVKPTRVAIFQRLRLRLLRLIVAVFPRCEPRIEAPEESSETVTPQTSALYLGAWAKYLQITFMSATLHPFSTHLEHLPFFSFLTK
jgi:hypothetical protein